MIKRYVILSAVFLMWLTVWSVLTGCVTEGDPVVSMPPYRTTATLTSHTRHTEPSTEPETKTDRPTTIPSMVTTTGAMPNPQPPPIPVPSLTEPEVVLRELTPGELFERCLPSVVSINLTIPPTSFYGERTDVFCGVIIDTDGHILTSYEKLRRGINFQGKLTYGAALTVFPSGRGTPLAAELIAFDELSSLAVLKIEFDEETMRTARLHSMLDYEVGDAVAQIVFPKESPHVATLLTGIINNRLVLGVRDDGYFDGQFLTNLDSLPGAEGAPVFDRYGRLLGLSVMPQYSGYAHGSQVTPLEVIRPLVNHMVRTQDRLGMGFGVVVTDRESEPDLFERHDYPPGLYVKRVLVERTAYVAGLREGDILMSVNGNSMREISNLVYYMEQLKPGLFIEMTVYRPSEDADLVLSAYLQEVDPIYETKK